MSKISRNYTIMYVSIISALLQSLNTPKQHCFLKTTNSNMCAAVSGLFFHYAHESKEKVFFRKSQYRLLAKYLQHSVRDSLYH